MEIELKTEILRIAEASSTSFEEMKEKVRDMFDLFNLTYPFELSPKE